jgi:cobalamin biosynthesis Mg chelatase CobN
VAKNKRRKPIDPTQNVMGLVAGQVKRLDDLAEANEQLAELREKRQDDLRSLEAQCVREMSEARAQFDEALRMKETQRIDAIRAVDVQAVQRAAEVSAVQATTLATQVQASAETLRTQVATTATAQTTALAAALEPIQKDISELRKTQYEQQGQKAAQVETRATRAEDRGSSQWIIGLIIGIILAAVQFALHYLK